MSIRFNKLDDNIYVNVSIAHLDSDGYRPSLCKTNVSYTDPYLQNSEDYYASIISADIPLSEVPIFRFNVPDPANYPNRSSMILQIITTTATFSQYLQYIPQNNFPSPKYYDPTNPYYYVFNIQIFVDSLNLALFSACVAGLIPFNKIPFFYFDPITQLFKLYIVADFFDLAQIVVNAELQSYLDGFGWNLYDQINGFYQFVPYNSPFNTYPSVINSPLNDSTPAFIFTQDFQSVIYMLPMRKIVIVTNNIPINAESLPVLMDTGQQMGESNYLPVFLDYDPGFKNLSDASIINYYRPSGQFKLSDMSGGTSLRKFDLQVYWLDNLGRLSPLFLNINQTANIKVAFFKKSLYNHK